MEIDYIAELKQDKKTAPMIENNIEEGYKIRIVYRGEGLFYHNIIDNKAFICDIQIRTGVIFQKTINRWDDNSKIENKELILHRLCNYFLTIQQITPVVVN